MSASGAGEPGPSISLREISKDTVRAICRLAVAPEQNGFVAPNAVSLAEALFEPKAWYRAVYAGEEPVGFVMLFDDPEAPEYYLWRFMIAAGHQGRGFGKQALAQVIAYVRSRPRAGELTTSCVPGEGSPCGFYQKMGFAFTGEVDENELVMRLPLSP
jgi:diamine N-acetyltransferase